jgi:flotillin
LLSRYKSCPSDKILVIFGKLEGGCSYKCIHGGGAFVLPFIQDYSYLSLTPISIKLSLQNAFTKDTSDNNQEFVNLDVKYTVAISTDEAIMNNAAERLLNLSIKDVEDLAKEIILGQLRLCTCSLSLNEILYDRERLLREIIDITEPEINKIGLKIIEVNLVKVEQTKN